MPSFRQPPIRPRHTPFGPSRLPRDRDAALLARIPGTPQYNYSRGIGAHYRMLRAVHVMCDRLRSIPRFVWLLGFIGYFVFVLLRMTVYSDYSFQEQKRLENVALPTADQLNSLFSGRVPAPSAQPAKK